MVLCVFCCLRLGLWSVVCVLLLVSFWLVSASVSVLRGRVLVFFVRGLAWVLLGVLWGLRLARALWSFALVPVLVRLSFGPCFVLCLACLLLGVWLGVRVRALGGSWVVGSARCFFGSAVFKVS